jgi:ATP-binding cassette subfamily C exporter for protease/lipase
MTRCPAWLARSDLGRALWTFRREFAWVGVFSAIANLLMLSPTLYMMQVFDRVMHSRSELTLVALSLIILVFFATLAFAEWLRSRLLVRAGVRFDEFLNARVFTATFEANLNQATNNPVKAFSDLTNVRQFLTGNGVFAFFDTPWTPVYIGVLFLMHPMLGWTSVFFLVVLALMAWYGNRLTAPLHEKAQDDTVSTSTYLNGKLRNAEAVHAMGMVSNLRRQWLPIYTGQLVSQRTAAQRARQVQATVKFVQYTQQSLILAVGAWLMIHNELSMGSMIASNALMSNALRPISTMVSTWRMFVEARAAYLRLETLLNEHPERPEGHAAEVVRGEVTLRGLVATATNRPAPILKGLDAVFQPGEVIGIVGPSGAGKSTLARCLVGIWPQTEGEVLLDGRPIGEWNREELGPHIGYLPQDIEMFDGSIAENIARFGKVDSEKVIAAARATGIHDMVLRLPRGYDTPMGLAGQMMSGGQRQRIGLARAMYGDPELLVLDEPNANLDDPGVAALIRSVRKLKERGATVFMVVHQRNLLSVADRVMVMNDGVITQLAGLEQMRNQQA